MEEKQADMKFCADCGAQINLKAEICPKCGVRQVSKKKKGKLSVLIIAIVVVIGGLFVTGILAAIAIPQFSAYRQKAYNSAAQSDIKNAKTSAESYFADNQVYPPTLEKAGFVASKDVSVEYERVDDKTYVIVSSHVNGSKQYMVTSDKPAIFQRDKSGSSGFSPI